MILRVTALTSQNHDYHNLLRISQILWFSVFWPDPSKSWKWPKKFQKTLKNELLLQKPTFPYVYPQNPFFAIFTTRNSTQKRFISFLRNFWTKDFDPKSWFWENPDILKSPSKNHDSRPLKFNVRPNSLIHNVINEYYLPKSY